MEKLADYEKLAERFPQVKMLSSAGWPVDEALAAADIVVVHSSGLGSDALVKRRLTVILDAIDFPFHHGRELVEQAGCPRAASAAELRDILERLLTSEEARQKHRRAAEAFVENFCAFYGDESAAKIAESIHQALGLPGTGTREDSSLIQPNDNYPSKRSDETGTALCRMPHLWGRGSTALDRRGQSLRQSGTVRGPSLPRL